MKLRKFVVALCVAITCVATSLEAVVNYLHPEASHPTHSPMPVMEDCDLVTGVYYNVLFPAERQNQELRALMHFLFAALDERTTAFLTPEQFETMKGYGLKSAPRQALANRLALYTLDGIQEGLSIEEALQCAQSHIEQRDIPLYQGVIEQLRLLQAQEQPGSPTDKRFTVLIEALEECVNGLATAFEHDVKMITEEFKKDHDTGIRLLEKSRRYEKTEASAKPERHLELFEHRLNVIEQAVDSVLDKTPNAAMFLALQEVTPDALEEMKTRWKQRHFTWISYNNITGEETRLKAKEEVFGESAAFTSTLALSPKLKVQRVALASLPSPSGSARKILGVEVLNTNTGRSLAIFTTHTDHLVQNTLYHDTAVAVHQFVTEFLQDNRDLPRVFGGDLNAFEGSGAPAYIDEMRQGPFAGARLSRRSRFYAPEQIADATFLGRETTTLRHV